MKISQIKLQLLQWIMDLHYTGPWAATTFGKIGSSVTYWWGRHYVIYFYITYIHLSLDYSGKWGWTQLDVDLIINSPKKEGPISRYLGLDSSGPTDIPRRVWGRFTRQRETIDCEKVDLDQRPIDRVPQYGWSHQRWSHHGLPTHLGFSWNKDIV